MRVSVCVGEREREREEGFPVIRERTVQEEEQFFFSIFVDWSVCSEKDPRKRRQSVRGAVKIKASGWRICRLAFRTIGIELRGLIDK